MILDQLLPGRLGTELLRQWRAEGAQFPVIIISSVTSDQVVVEAFQLGASDFVRKPFSPIELVERVRHQLSLATSSVGEGADDIAATETPDGPRRFGSGSGVHENTPIRRAS